MDYLADTNIILRLAEPAHPMHGATLRAVTKLFSDGEQTLPSAAKSDRILECCNPSDKNGFGWTATQTDGEVAILESTFTVLPDTPAIYTEWRRLVAAHSVLGKQVHDTRIVAAMNVHQITHLLTFNTAD